MPDLVDIGWSLLRDGDYDNALERFRLAVAVNQNDPRAHFALAEVLLARGEHVAGWREFTWRRTLNKATAGHVAKMQAPEWNGMTLRNGRILVICDEGLGDAIMFGRYLPLVASRCRELVLGWGSEHQHIFSHIDGPARIAGNWAELPHHYDAWALICDMPYIFGGTPETMPPAPYIFARADEQARWKEYFDKLFTPGNFRVGIVWSGSASYSNDGERSLRLEQLMPVIEQPRCEFVALQKEVRSIDEPRLSALPNVHDLSARLTDFSETIAAISQLDLVIAVDTSVAHLAGAMGKPTWVLTRRPAEWRWGIEGEKTVWYDKMRLFRQSKAGRWDEPLLRMAASLRALAQTKAAV